MNGLSYVRVSRADLQRVAELGKLKDLAETCNAIVSAEIDLKNGDLVLAYKKSLLLSTPEGKDEAISMLLNNLKEIANPRSETERRSAIHARSTAEMALHEFYQRYGDPSKGG